MRGAASLCNRNGWEPRVGWIYMGVRGPDCFHQGPIKDRGSWQYASTTGESISEKEKICLLLCERGCRFETQLGIIKIGEKEELLEVL